jgi:ketosteroid isomerase-like protein
MSEENVETLRAALAAFNERDAGALAALLTPDVEIVPIRAALETGAAYTGPNAATEWIAAVDASWENLIASVREWRDDRDAVVALGRLRGRGRESGVDIDADAVAVARFRDGRIRRLRIYTSVAEGLAAAGLSE